MLQSRAKRILQLLFDDTPKYESTKGLSSSEKSAVLQNYVEKSSTGSRVQKELDHKILDNNLEKTPKKLNGKCFDGKLNSPDNNSTDVLDDHEFMVKKYFTRGSSYESVENDITNFSDDSIVDPDFVPSDEFESKQYDQEESQIEIIVENKYNETLNIEDSGFDPNELFESSDLRQDKSQNNLNIIVKSTETQTTDSKRNTKQDFCIFCKKLVTKIPRHFETVHKNENKVKEFAAFPKGNYYRNQLIDKIRKEGNFTFNTDSSSNTVLTCRRPQATKNRNSDHYKPCPICKGFYSKLTLRRHVRKCASESRGDRNVLIRSRQIHGRIHLKACNILKNDIFPVLRDDEISDAVRYDELAIIYANKLCSKYRSKHHHAMIRSKLRQIGRFIVEMRKLDTQITDYSSIFEPKNFDNVIQAINIIARLNENTGKYGAPATAFSIGTLLKNSTNVLLFECIKQENKEKKILAKEFLKLITQDFAYCINRTVAENMLESKRQKKIVLPNVNDIKMLNKYLEDGRRKNAIDLKEIGFSYQSWKNLVCFTFVSIQVFNRRRTGELERALILDFQNYQSVNERTDKDIFESLNPEAQEATKRYVRFTIRGKLARGVPVLLHKDLVEDIELILRFRKEANVPETNPFIFGLPGPNNYTYLRANRYIRDYSVACGAKNPQSLRGTQLRKHIATQSVLLNLQETEVHDLANFLGHDDKIHKDHYRMPILTRDIAQMSRLLELAQGDDDNNEEPDSESDEDNRSITKSIVEETSAEYQKENVEIEESALSNETGRENISQESTKIIHTKPEKRRETGSFNTSIQHATPATPKKNKPILKKQATCEKYIVRNKRIEEDKNVDLLNKEIEESESKSAGPRKHTNSCRGSITSTPEKQRIRESFTTSIKRTTWTTPEKKKARLLFAENLKSHTLPSFDTCADYVTKFDVFKKRTPMQLKLWVHNQLMKIKKQSSPETNTKLVRTWTTPEKHVAKAAFANHLKTNKLPSLAECSKVREENSALKFRSPAMIKAFINNELVRRKLYYK